MLETLGQLDLEKFEGMSLVDQAVSVVTVFLKVKARHPSLILRPLPHSHTDIVSSLRQQNPELQMWSDLAVILGDPVGYALVPALNTSIVRSNLPQSDAEMKSRLAGYPNLQQDIEVLAAKNILFNPFLPAPCIRSQPSCGLLKDTLTPQDEALQGVYEEAKAGNITDAEFAAIFSKVSQHRTHARTTARMHARTIARGGWNATNAC